ncbi:hypothetical protein BLTE_08210 [Blastochloris tepida]|uniref:Uncharacterized protein n=2 Tax=Blastochloris tepida TaxID=2233851 RepID=A0A348FXV3_9HYPH|nr:hypothetical protein BLTE_08210 [Blastochloris tepida]
MSRRPFDMWPYIDRICTGLKDATGYAERGATAAFAYKAAHGLRWAFEYAGVLWIEQVSLPAEQRDRILGLLVCAEAAMRAPLEQVGCSAATTKAAMAAFATLIVMLAETPEQRLSRFDGQGADAMDTVVIFRNAMHSVELTCRILDRARERRRATVDALQPLVSVGTEGALACRR